MSSGLLLGILFQLYLAHQTRGQFPRSCTDTESLETKTCCPVPSGFSNACGAPARGECADISVQNWTNRFDYFKEFHKIDDRTNWPRLFYTKTCKCKKQFAGFDCGKCKFGYRGSECSEKKKPLIRKDVRKMTEGEKENFMRVVHMSRHVTSDYTVATTFYDDMISNGSFIPRFTETSVYDFYAWLHYYSARNTYIKGGQEESDIDFAHEGQGFPTWHRLYLLEWERSLQEVSGDENFALPYWDWTVATDCDICQEDFIGKSDNDGVVRGKYFSNNSWHMICVEELIGKNDDKGLRICDPKRHKVSGLARRPGTDKTFNITSLPRKDEVDFALCLDSFDNKPYDKTAEKSFRNTLEGYANTKTGKHSPKDHTLHNQVHIFLGGTLPRKHFKLKSGEYLTSGVMKDVPSAANDPIFFLHHSFIDKIFEKWLRRHKKSDAQVLHNTSAPIGHNSDSPVVPFFPLWIHKDLFKESSELGYTYEDLEENGISSNDEKDICDKTKSAAPTVFHFWIPGCVMAVSLYESIMLFLYQL